MKQRLILAALAVIFSAIMLLFPLHSSLQAQVGTIDLTSLMQTIGPILAPRQTLTAEAQGVQLATLRSQSSQTAAVGLTQTVLALTNTSTPSSTYTPSMTYTPSTTYTPSVTLTPSDTDTATPYVPTATPNATEVQQTLEAGVQQAATEIKQQQIAQTATAIFQASLAAIVGGSSTATLTPSYTITPTIGPTPTPNATQLKQTLEAAVLTSVAQTAQAQLGLTSTVIAQQAIASQVGQFFTATAQANRALLISGLTPLSIANAGQIKKLAELKGHTGTVTGVAFSPDGTLIASSGSDNSIRLWDVKTGKQIAINQGLSDRLEVAFNGDGTVLVAGSSDGTVRTFDTASAKPGLVIKASDLSGTKISSVAFSIDGTLIAAGSTDGIIRTWDSTGGGLQLTLKGHSGAVTSIAFSPDGTRLLSGGSDGTVRVWELKTGTQLARYSDVQVTGIAFSPDGSLIADASYTGRTQIRDGQTGDVKVSLTGPSNVITGVSFSPDGSMIAASSFDGTVRIWDVTSGQQLVSLNDHAGNVTGVAFSSDGARLASCGDDGTIRLWGIQKTS